MIHVNRVYIASCKTARHPVRVHFMIRMFIQVSCKMADAFWMCHAFRKDCMMSPKSLGLINGAFLLAWKCWEILTKYDHIHEIMSLNMVIWFVLSFHKTFRDVYFPWSDLYYMSCTAMLLYYVYSWCAVVTSV